MLFGLFDLFFYLLFLLITIGLCHGMLQGLTPQIGEFHRFLSLSVETYHHCLRRRFYHSFGLLHQHLLQPETLVRDAHAARVDSDIFTEEYRTDVATIDVGYHHVNSLPVDIAIDDMFEKSRLARVEEGEVDRVVEMSEYVDVVKSELQIYGVSEL